MKKKVMLGIAFGIIVGGPVTASKMTDMAIKNAIQSGSYVVDFSSFCPNKNLSKEQKAQVQELAYRIHDELNDRLAAIGNLKDWINGNARLPSERRVALSLKEYESFLNHALRKNRRLIMQNCPGVHLPRMRVQ